MSIVPEAIEERGLRVAGVVGGTVLRDSKFRLSPQRQSSQADRLADICARPEFVAGSCDIYEYRKAVVHSEYGVVALSDQALILEAWQVAKHYIPADATPNFGSWWAEQLASNAHQTIETPVLHCLHRSTDAFGHFVLDGVAALTLVLEDIIGGRVKVLIPHFAERWIRGRLQEIGIEEKHTISANGLVECDMLLVPNLLDTRNTFRPNPEMLDRVSKLIPHPEGDRRRKIYLSRKNQKAWSRRFIRNEDEVEAALSDAGIEIVEPANRSFPDQARLFADADIIIGPHGSAFANLCFARPGVEVVDLMPEGWVGFWGGEGTPERWLLDLTTARRQNYTVVLCESETTGPTRYRGPELTTIESTVRVDALMDVLGSL